MGLGTAGSGHPRAARWPRVRTGARAHPCTGFAWLRMIGALTVVVDHCAPLTDPTRLTVLPQPWNLSPGYVALMGFFAMSGWQISDSWRQDPTWWRFAAKRVLRLWPPLLLVVAVTALVVGPLVSSLGARRYLAHPDAWGYVVHNAGLYTLQHRLPGVFDTNPYPWSANGSLWTLPMELTGYLLVLAVGLVGLVVRARWLTVVALVVLVVLDRRFDAGIGDPGDGGSLLQVPIGSLVAFLVAFALGMVLHAYRETIPLSPAVAVALVGLQVVVHQSELGALTLPFMAGYGAIVLAHHWPARLEGYDAWVYGSYGLYIWAFPVQQLLILAGADRQWLLTVLALPVCYLCGCLSWRYVEVPTLSLRRYLVRRPPLSAEPPEGGSAPGPASESPQPAPAPTASA